MDQKTILELSSAGLNQECLQACQQLLQSEPEKSFAWKFAGKSLLALGQYEKGQQYLFKAHQLDSPDPEIIKDIGNTFLNLGDKAAAVQWYKKSLEINNNYAPAINNLANLKRQSNNSQEAIDLFKKAIQADPKLIQAYYGAAASFLALGDLDQAKLFAEKGLECNISASGLNEILGIIFHKKSDHELAIVLYQKELEVNPKASTSLLNLGILLLQKGKVAEAIESFTKASAIAPSKQCSLLLAQARQSLGQFTEAITEYEKINTNESRNKLIPFNLGLCLLNIGKNSAAIKAFKKAIELDETFFPAWGSIGSALINEGRFQEALSATQKILELDPDNPNALINLYRIYKKLGETDHALDATLKSINQKVYDNSTLMLNFPIKKLGPTSKSTIETIEAELKRLTVPGLNNSSIYIGEVDKFIRKATEIARPLDDKIFSSHTQIHYRTKEKIPNCSDLMTFFYQHNAIAKRCHNCYKVQITVKSLDELLTINFLMKTIQFESNNFRKCMVELRKDSTDFYKCLIFCSNADEAKNIARKTSMQIKKRTTLDPIITAKRGCTEFTNAHSEYGKIGKLNNLHKGPEQLEEWKICEDKFFKSKDDVMANLTGHEFNLSEFLIVKNWILYAQAMNDSNAIAKYKDVSCENEAISKLIKLKESWINR